MRLYNKNPDKKEASGLRRQVYVALWGPIARPQSLPIQGCGIIEAYETITLLGICDHN